MITTKISTGQLPDENGRLRCRGQARCGLHHPESVPLRRVFSIRRLYCARASYRPGRYCNRRRNRQHREKCPFLPQVGINSCIRLRSTCLFLSSPSSSSASRRRLHIVAENSTASASAGQEFEHHVAIAGAPALVGARSSPASD